ncbi:hypothetical protein DPMN_179463 [Dreissena polymorpha]|uniref:Uncharacterized protein n=1 Tax=Dreissena polymorpha TaxID=45954 RepID=A0A9D4IKT0_DREPO|nr:hypothetical protein DPMN_179463 [Dreissena polymorpha]
MHSSANCWRSVRMLWRDWSHAWRRWGTWLEIVLSSWRTSRVTRLHSVGHSHRTGTSNSSWLNYRMVL